MTPTTATTFELPVRLPRGFSFSACLTLFRVSVRQFVRGKRLLVLALIFAMPTGLAALARYYNKADARMVTQLEESMVFYMIPQALVPLTALILAGGMIRDEVEGQTITYLLIRPIPRPLLYLAKLLAAWVVAAGLTLVFTSTALIAIHWGEPDLWGTVIPGHALRVSALSALSLIVYISLFGGLSLIFRWILPLGVAYIVVFEGFCANIDFAVRRVTVLWYVRILAERWFGMHIDAWGIKLDEAPSATEALVTLATAALVMALGAALLFGTRELRVKTPDGS